MPTASALRKEFKKALRTVRKHHAFRDLRVSFDLGQASEFPAKRDYAYCQQAGPEHYRIVFSPKILKDGMNRFKGLLYHEFGHAMANTLGFEDHSERDADDLAAEVFGSPIYYDDLDIQTVRKTSKSIRPPYLHQ